MKNKLIDYRTPLSLLNWVSSRNKHFGRYILYSVSEAIGKEIQNHSITLEDKEYPLFECYAKDTNDQYTYLLITTHFLISIVDGSTYKADIECISFTLELEDIIAIRKGRTNYNEYACYDLQSSVGIIPIWIENGICEHILWGVFNQLHYLKMKYGIKNN